MKKKWRVSIIHILIKQSSNHDCTLLQTLFKQNFISVNFIKKFYLISMITYFHETTAK